jgi:hypothetical protein
MLNEINAAFWLNETQILEAHRRGEANLEIAAGFWTDECARPIPLEQKRSYDELLKRAGKVCVIALQHQSRKGGKVSKTGPLQKFILKTVEVTPSMTEHALLLRLKNLSGVRIDKECDCLADEPPMLHFTDGNGAEESALISGLKGRLFRAKSYARSSNRPSRRALKSCGGNFVPYSAVSTDME